MSDEALTRRDFLARTTVLGAGLATLGIPHLVRASAREDVPTLDNGVISASWSVTSGALRARSVTDRRDGRQFPLPEQIFALTLTDGTRLDATQLRVVGTPAAETISPVPKAARAARQFSGRRLTVNLE